MSSTRPRILLVEDDAADAEILRRFLHTSMPHGHHLEQTRSLAAGLDLLRGDDFEALLLDLGLPDSIGMETFQRVHDIASDVPIIVLSGLDDEEVAVQAVREGAQDYLVKGEFSGPLLARAIRYAIERHRMQSELLSLSLTDALTGLLNRRGFETLARQQLKQMRRFGTSLALVFLDVDGLKEINDSLGHHTGDQALAETAALVRLSFRDADIQARLGGDEFAVLLIDVHTEGVSVALARLRENLEEANRKPGRTFTLAMSVGVADFDPAAPATFEDLLAAADRAMYTEKRAKTT